MAGFKEPKQVSPPGISEAQMGLRLPLTNLSTLRTRHYSGPQVFQPEFLRPNSVKSTNDNITL